MIPDFDCIRDELKLSGDWISPLWGRGWTQTPPGGSYWPAIGFRQNNLSSADADEEEPNDAVLLNGLPMRAKPYRWDWKDLICPAWRHAVILTQGPLNLGNVLCRQVQLRFWSIRKPELEARRLQRGNLQQFPTCKIQKTSSNMHRRCRHKLFVARRSLWAPPKLAFMPNAYASKITEIKKMCLQVEASSWWERGSDGCQWPASIATLKVHFQGPLCPDAAFCLRFAGCGTPRRGQGQSAWILNLMALKAVCNYCRISRVISQVFCAGLVVFREFITLAHCWSKHHDVGGCWCGKGFLDAAWARRAMPQLHADIKPIMPQFIRLLVSCSVTCWRNKASVTQVILELWLL